MQSIPKAVVIIVGGLLVGLVLGLAAGVGLAGFFAGNNDNADDCNICKNYSNAASTANNRNTDTDYIDPPSSSAPSPYKKFQAFGFQIYTGGAPAFLNDNRASADDSGDDDGVVDDDAQPAATTGKPNPECYGIDSNGHSEGVFSCYLGLKDRAVDVKRRLKVMEDAVERAYRSSSSADDPETLKIFVAPEFFFRGVNGAYMFESDDVEAGTPCGPVCQILQGLERIVEQERFKDWLFLFGTVIASEALPTEDPYDYLFYNFAPMYKGGTDDAGKRFLVPKRFVSNMDFLTPLRHTNGTLFTKELFDGAFHQYLSLEDNNATQQASTTLFNPFEANHRNYDNNMWAKYKGELTSLGYTMIEYGWFLMDEILFSVEICVDHDAQSALKSFLANLASRSSTLIPSSRTIGLHSGGRRIVDRVPFSARQAQLSLVSSAGMTVNADSLVLVDGGSIILQDGVENGYARKFWQDDNEKRKHHDQFEGGSEVVERIPVLTPTEVYFEFAIRRPVIGVPLYGGGDDDDDRPDGDTWKRELDGVFTTKMYEPSIAVYEPARIAAI